MYLSVKFMLLKFKLLNIHINFNLNAKFNYYRFFIHCWYLGYVQLTRNSVSRWSRCRRSGRSPSQLQRREDFKLVSARNSG